MNHKAPRSSDSDQISQHQYRFKPATQIYISGFTASEEVRRRPTLTTLPLALLRPALFAAAGKIKPIHLQDIHAILLHRPLRRARHSAIRTINTSFHAYHPHCRRQPTSRTGRSVNIQSPQLRFDFFLAKFFRTRQPGSTSQERKAAGQSWQRTAL